MGREADELVDVDLFEAVPDNPNDPLADGVAALSASLEQVGRRQRWHDMQVQRYDVLDRRSGEWALRVWHPTNSPVVEDGRVTALVHQVQDITPSGDDLHRALMSYRDLLGSGERTAGHDHPVARRIDTSLAMLADHEALVAEVGPAPASPEVPSDHRPGQGHADGSAPLRRRRRPGPGLPGDPTC